MSNRKNSRARTLALPVMPDRTITFLTLGAGLLFAVYLAFVIMTVVFATMQTSLAVDVRDAEGSISTLETTYYAAIAKQNASSPSSIGLVQPQDVKYAVAKPASGLSFAGN